MPRSRRANASKSSAAPGAASSLTPYVTLARRGREVVKAAAVEDEVEPVAEPERRKARDIAYDPPHFDTLLFSPTACPCERSLDRIDSRHLPTVLDEADRLRAGAATDIERTAWRERASSV